MIIEARPVFDAYASALLKTGFKSRLLYVFLGLTEAHPLDPHGFEARLSPLERDAWIEILFTAHEVNMPQVTFSSLAELADAQDPRWAVIATKALRKEDLELPSELEAELKIEEMCAALRTGRVSGMAFFDRNGAALRPAGIARIERPSILN